MARLVELLGLEQRQSEKLAGYYHELESGLLDTERVDRRVFEALTSILSLSRPDALRWRRPAPPAAGAFYRAEPGFKVVVPPAPAAPTPAPSEWDEVDRLFRGEPPGS